MKTKITFVILGSAIALGSIWGAALVNHIYGTWTDLPAILTGLLGLVGGVVIAIHKFIELP